MATREEREAKSQSLYTDLATGCRVARDAIILANMKLCEQLAKKYVRQAKAAAELYDDLLSEAYLALVRAVDSLATTTDVESVSKWLAKQIMRRLIEYEREQELGPSRRRHDQMKKTFAKLYAELEERFISDRMSEDEFTEAVEGLKQKYGDSAVLKRRELTEQNGGCKTDSRFEYYELTERLMHYCRDHTDRQIIHQRMRLYTYAEIAAQMKTSKDTVQRRCKAVEERYLAANQPSLAL